MRKHIIRIIIIVLLILSSVMTVRALPKNSEANIDDQFKNFNYIETMLLESSRYTQKEDIDQDRLDLYHNELMFRPDSTYLDKYGYISYDELEDEFLKVYIEPNSFSVIVYDKLADYYYSSNPEFQGYDGLEGNVTNRRLINSGLWIDYVSTTKPEQSAITTASLFTFAEVNFKPEAQSPTSPYNPYELVEGSYKEDKAKVELKSKDNEKVIFEVKIDNKIDISFDIEISLNSGDLSFKIPNESIKEDLTNFSVLAISLFPYFGSTRKDFVPGYMIIPDGVGALVRLNKPNDTTFYGRFYGDDNGYSKTYNNHLSVPMFGIIHENNKTGFYAHVSEGEEQVILSANFYGRTNYNRLTSKYYLREMTRRIIDRAGSGTDTVYTHKTSSSYQINYSFLSNSDANYVGAANHYRNYLIEEEKVNIQTFDENINLYLSILMGDNEQALFGSRRITMTTPEEAINIYNELKDLGISSQTVNLLGYSKDGASQNILKMKWAGSNRNYKSLVNEITDDNNKVLLTQNYSVAWGSTRISSSKDVAKAANRLKMSYTRTNKLFDDTHTLNYIYPQQSYNKAKSDLKFVEKYNVGMQINDIGANLFSTYNKTIFDRNSSMKYYQELLSMYDTVMLNRPNSYLWNHIDGYTNMAITNAQYNLYSDLVPLIPIILQGIMPKYTPYLNFNATGQERLLQMVDFNLYPSFIVTYEDTFKMRYTSSKDYYSTKYDDYKEEIVETYHYLNDALKHIKDTPLISREVITSGVIKNTYGNGVVIYINYTTKNITVDGHQILKENYKVIL